MSAKRGFALGCIGSLLLVTVIVSIILILNSASYQGECISFEPPAGDCSLFEYLLQVLVLVLISSPFTHTFLFFSLLAVILMLPILGIGIGRRFEPKKSSDASNELDRQ